MIKYNKGGSYSMGKKYFRDLAPARVFAKTKNRKVFSTSSVWQQKDKRRRGKNYLVKF